jgi:hypothetical protein
MANLNAALRLLQQEQSQLSTQLQAINKALAALHRSSTRTRRLLTAAARGKNRRCSEEALGKVEKKEDAIRAEESSMREKV